MAHREPSTSSDSSATLLRDVLPFTGGDRGIRSGAGFTIVELVVVIIVIAILAAIVIVAYNGISKRAVETVMQEDLHTVASALGKDNVTNGGYPATLSAANGGLGLSPSGSNQLNYWNNVSDYCVDITNAGTSTVYRIKGSTGTIEIGTCGAAIDGNPATLDCPTGFIEVPGNSKFGTNGFCTMKYEAKNVGNVATSIASGTPWVSISQINATSVAAGACSGCHLMTEGEWMTLAANILSVPSNWMSGTVGSGSAFIGNADGAPGTPQAASTDDSSGYLNTGNSGDNQRRTLRLNNGEVIWDLAGNAAEWTQGVIDSTQRPSTGTSGYAWYEWNAGNLTWGTFPALSRPSAISTSAGAWTSTNGTGMVFINADRGTAQDSFVRGGKASGSGGGGLLQLILDNGPTTTNALVGFRASR